MNFINIDEGIEDYIEVDITIDKFIEIINLLKLNINLLNVKIECLMYENKLNINLSKFHIFIYIDKILSYTLFFNSLENFIENKYYKLINITNKDLIRTIYYNVSNNEVLFEISDNINESFIELFILQNPIEIINNEIIYCKIEKYNNKCISNINNNNYENINLENYNNFHNYLIKLIN
jgi:hypothetical protein